MVSLAIPRNTRLVNKELRGGGRGSEEGGSLHLKSTPDQDPPAHNVIAALPKVDRYIQPLPRSPAQNPIRYSPFCEEVGTGSSSETG